jgi:HlyD family secretion protein
MDTSSEKSGGAPLCMQGVRTVVSRLGTPKGRTVVLVAVGLAGLAGVLATIAPRIGAEETTRGTRLETADEKRWQAVAPGRVEPASGEIKIAPSLAGVIGEVLVKPNDKVFSGEPLIRLLDGEAQARVAAAEAQVALRRRLRNDEAAPSRAAARRRAEDATADAERAVSEAQAALDKAAIDQRAGRGSEPGLESARSTLARAQERLRLQRAELRRIENDNNTPLPSQTEGQLNVARAELLAAEAAVAKMTIRAPAAGTVLQVNAKPGELASPSAAQPLVLLGDVSALRVRAELDERDFGEIRVGQLVVVRAAAFRGREFAGRVSFIAPVVEPGRISARGQRTLTDVDVVEVLVELTEGGPLAVGMKVDVYFRADGVGAQRQ